MSSFIPLSNLLRRNHKDRVKDYLQRMDFEDNDSCFIAPEKPKPNTEVEKHYTPAKVKEVKARNKTTNHSKRNHKLEPLI